MHGASLDRDVDIDTALIRRPDAAVSAETDHNKIGQIVERITDGFDCRVTTGLARGQNRQDNPAAQSVAMGLSDRRERRSHGGFLFGNATAAHSGPGRGVDDGR